MITGCPKISSLVEKIMAQKQKPLDEAYDRGREQKRKEP